MLILTGGAGFIGSALLFELNQRGCSDVIVVDVVDHPRKERNLAALKYEELIGVGEFREKLAGGAYDRSGVSGVLHLGACSATTETDWDYLYDNNVVFSQELIRWCARGDVRCVYASSAATYGDGESGYSDDHALFDNLKPMNLYGKSKLDLDIWARDQGLLGSVAGLRYFNVFGPNEWHKEGMRSVVNKKLPEIEEEGRMTLFKSYRDDYSDGGQERDFVYVSDVVDITLWMLGHPEANGVFNVGTGIARTWNDLARSMFSAVSKTENIEYVEMPDNLREQYQYHTRADISKLRSVGYDGEFVSLESAVKNYVVDHLQSDRHLGE